MTISKAETRNLLKGLAFLSPWIIGFSVFTFLPIILSLYYSFCDYSLLQKPAFVGMDNYRQMFSDPIFWKVLRNSLEYAAMSLPVGLAVSLGVAILLNQRVAGQSIFRTIIFLPSLVPTVASAILWMWLFDQKLGLFNNLLSKLHIPGPDWLGIGWVLPSLVLMSLWGVGNTVVIYLAGLQDVPRELYEAADLDGANAIHRLIHVTLPMISPVIFFNLVMAIIGVLQVYDAPVIMTGGGPNRASYFFTMYLYDKAFHFLQMGYASAMAWIQLLIILALYRGGFWIERKMGALPGQMMETRNVAVVDYTALSPARKRTRKPYGMVAVYITLLVICVAAVTPFLWMVSTSLKDGNKVMDFPPHWIPNPVRFDNYPKVLSAETTSFQLWARNTLVIAVLAVSGTTLSSAVVAYGFARIRFRGRTALFALMLSTMMIPFPVTMVSLFSIFRWMGDHTGMQFLGSFKPLWLPAWFGSAFSIFLLRQFFLTIPDELSEAARIDGCSEWGIFWRIIMPLSRPALTVVALFTFMGVWRDFIGPRVYLQRTSQYTLALGLQSFQSQHGGTPWHLLMAAAVLVITPVIIIFFLAQKTFIEGIATTGLK